MRGLGKGVSGKPYPCLCNARRPRLEPGTFRSQAVRLPLALGPPFMLLYLTGPNFFWIPYNMLNVEIPGYMANKGTKNPFML